MGRRQITTAVTMAMLVGIVVLGAVWGWKALVAPFPTSTTTAEPSPTCVTQQVDAGGRLKATQVTVSVYNAGSRAGLADQTLAKLANRGFEMGEAGNAPAGTKVRTVQVWSTDKNDAAAKLVARQFGRRLKVVHSKVDLGPGVDVLVGDKFRRLVKAPTSIRVKTPQQVCVPVNPLTASPS